MKSLAVCSNDFYSNIPDWLSSYDTPSFVSNLPNLPEFDSLISALINRRNTMTPTEFNDIREITNAPLPNPSNNFLLYYYVEYM